MLMHNEAVITAKYIQGGSPAIQSNPVLDVGSVDRLLGWYQFITSVLPTIRPQSRNKGDEAGIIVKWRFQYPLESQMITTSSIC
jgi:hypothetical protein